MVVEGGSERDDRIDKKKKIMFIATDNGTAIEYQPLSYTVYHDGS